MHVLRAGGEYLESRESRGWMALTIVGLALVLMVTAAFGIRGRSPLVHLTAIVVGTGVVLYAKRGIRTIIRHLRATRKGRLGEQLTTQLVSRLSDDYYLINDIVLGRGNIDHVVVGPCGILVIETKRVAGTIGCDGDAWMVNGRAVKSYSKQAKASAMAVKSLVATRCPELRNEYIQAAVVLTDPLCRVVVQNSQVAVVRFSELLPLIATLASQRRMHPEQVKTVAGVIASVPTPAARSGKG